MRDAKVELEHHSNNIIYRFMFVFATLRVGDYRLRPNYFMCDNTFGVVMQLRDYWLRNE